MRAAHRRAGRGRWRVRRRCGGGRRRRRRGRRGRRGGRRRGILGGLLRRVGRGRRVVPHAAATAGAARRRRTRGLARAREPMARAAVRLEGLTDAERGLLAASIAVAVRVGLALRRDAAPAVAVVAHVEIAAGWAGRVGWRARSDAVCRRDRGGREEDCREHEEGGAHHESVARSIARRRAPGAPPRDARRRTAAGAGVRGADRCLGGLVGATSRVPLRRSSPWRRSTA